MAAAIYISIACIILCSCLACIWFTWVPYVSSGDAGKILYKCRKNYQARGACAAESLSVGTSDSQKNGFLSDVDTYETVPDFIAVRNGFLANIAFYRKGQEVFRKTFEGPRFPLIRQWSYDLDHVGVVDRAVHEVRKVD